MSPEIHPEHLSFGQPAILLSDIPRGGITIAQIQVREIGGADIFLDHSGSTYIIPKLSLYSTGLMPPKVILIRSSLYQ